MIGLKENSLSQKILVKINDLLKLMGVLLVWDYRELYKLTGLGPLYTNSLPRYFYHLKKRNYLRETKTRVGKKITLTSKGKIEIIKYRIKLRTKKPRWNGKWFAICWDVPEISRRDRDYLRSKLRWLGFKELQKSLWIFPFNVEGEVKELIRLYRKELAGDVRFLIIKNIEKDQDLRKYFAL